MMTVKARCKFLSYGPINEKLNYHVPRTALIKQAQTQLLGEEPKEGGHSITVWGPRQRDKTWIMQKVMWHLQDDETYHWLDVVKLNVQDLKQVRDVDVAVNEIAIRLFSQLGKELPLPLQIPKALKDFHQIFTQQALDKPLILTLDEFDALPTDVINSLTSVFRNIQSHRQDQGHKPTREKNYLLHGLEKCPRRG